MIKVTSWNSNTAKHMNYSTLIHSVTIHEIEYGYEVIINLHTRNFTLDGQISSSNANGKTKGILFDVEGVLHTVEWEVPTCVDDNKYYQSFIDVEKDQVIYYYVDYDVLGYIKSIDRYESPLNRLKNTVNKLIES